MTKSTFPQPPIWGKADVLLSPRDTSATGAALRNIATITHVDQSVSSRGPFIKLIGEFQNTSLCVIFRHLDKLAIVSSPDEKGTANAQGEARIVPILQFKQGS